MIRIFHTSNATIQKYEHIHTNMDELAPLIAYQKAKQDQLVKQNCIVNRLLLTAELTDEQFQHLHAAQIRRNSIKETLLEIQDSIL